LFNSIEIRRNTAENPWSYRDLDARQRFIAERVRTGGAPCLLLSEVSPVITLGRRPSETDLLMSPENLSRLGVELLQTDRGGLATYHGPGQWVLFPVARLEDLTGDSRGVRRVTEFLLEIALEVGRERDPSCEIRWGCETGVWTSRGKFAAVGVHIEQGIVLHGLSVNGFRTSLSFQGLRPCGLDLPVDFLLGDPGAGTGVGAGALETEFAKLGESLAEVALEKFSSARSYNVLTSVSSEAITSPLVCDGS
jgi:lipoyl(octanoyl) transferase